MVMFQAVGNVHLTSHGPSKLITHPSTTALSTSPIPPAGECQGQLIRRGERDGRNVHTGGVNGVLVLRDGSTAITWSKDCTARVWDIAKCEVKLVITGHTDGIHTAALSPDEVRIGWLWLCWCGPVAVPTGNMHASFL